jgi:RNA polymerase sigma factor (sigma-70 family)
MVRARSEIAAEAEALTQYLDAIGREPLLSKEDEVELAIAIEHCHDADDELKRNGKLSLKRRRELKETIRRGERARERFIRANLRLVVSIAKRFAGQGLPLLDLIQEGNLGLITAVQRFDWRRGFKFSTYATWWIRQAIQRGIANKAHTVRLPIHVDDQVRRVMSKRLELTQKLGRDPKDREIARAAKVPVDKVQELMRLGRNRRTASIHQPIGEMGEEELGSLIEDVSAESPYDAVEESMLREELEEALLTVLDERERAVLAMRFGLDDGEPMTLRDTATELGLSHERVRQVERAALAKLREERRLSA